MKKESIIFVGTNYCPQFLRFMLLCENQLKYKGISGAHFLGLCTEQDQLGQKGIPCRCKQTITYLELNSVLIFLELLIVQSLINLLQLFKGIDTKHYKQLKAYALAWSYKCVCNSASPSVLIAILPYLSTNKSVFPCPCRLYK